MCDLDCGDRGCRYWVPEDDGGEYSIGDAAASAAEYELGE